MKKPRLRGVRQLPTAARLGGGQACTCGGPIWSPDPRGAHRDPSFWSLGLLLLSWSRQTVGVAPGWKEIVLSLLVLLTAGQDTPSRDKVLAQARATLSGKPVD